ncbi:Thioredoxin-like fold domain-containing protein [Aphelenchoides besseyi]|nr:Thioredoxin-like fold domain-containing protein [Aphelenchoides besseyi]KAI6228498.1 Thioredoxin-like fold domain-containing protein [Aphelenchoides besseyi]
MKIQYFYDIICPYSWLGFQILRQKHLSWRSIGQVEVDYLPFNNQLVHTRVHSYQWNDLSNAEREYKVNELRNIADHYNLAQGSFERMFESDCRSRATLLFLNVIRQERPHLHLKFMDHFWKQIFMENKPVALTNHFLEAARELEVPYSTISKFILRIENRENVLDILNRSEQLAEEKTISSPWIKVQTKGISMSFTEIMRLELIDEIFRDPFVIPQSDKQTRISAL